jgi:hypothetical protein
MKLLGLAGVVGVIGVAGVQVYRRRQRREWTELAPAELRERLHARLASAASTGMTMPKITD